MTSGTKALLALAGLGGAFYFLTKEPAKPANQGKELLPNLPPEIQQQLTDLLVNGNKTQLLQAADFWEARGYKEIAQALRLAAAKKAA